MTITPTPTNVTPLRPQISEAEAAALQLDSYVMHIKGQLCLHCSAGAEWSELYEVWTHPTKTRISALNVLKPTATLQGGLAIVYIRLPVTSVPICSECVEKLTVDDLPRAIPATTRSQWAETVRKKAVDRDAEARVAARTAPTRHVPTLGEL